MRSLYWQQKDWPDFKYEITNLEKTLFQFYQRAGHVPGILKAIPDDMQTETLHQEGPTGFIGGMNAKKYCSIGKVSKATATRDLQYLLEIDALIISGAGRSTTYSVNL